MLWKFCRSFFLKPQSLDTTYIKIGRMTAETSRETIKKELEGEIKKEGLRKTRQKINHEEFVLEQLIRSRTETNRLIQQECLDTLMERARQGYAVRGYTWEINQQRLHAIIPPDKAMEREEQIDWLKTRNSIFKSISRSYAEKAWEEIEPIIKSSL